MPTRALFRQRTDWMATHTGAALIVEAGLRSATLHLAHRIGDRARLGAVPGPITSAASEGPNVLIAAGRAQSVLPRSLEWDRRSPPNVQDSSRVGR